MASTEERVFFGDLWRAFRKHARQIGTIAACLGLLALGFALVRPPLFQSEASFHDKQTADIGGSSSLSLLKESFGLSGKEAQGVALLQSRRLLEEVASQNGYQAVLKRKGLQYTLLKRIGANICASWALFWKKEVPALSDPFQDLRVTDVIYREEVPLRLVIRFVDEEQFTVHTKGGEEWGEGRLGVSSARGASAFTLRGAQGSVLSGKSYTLKLRPLGTVAKKLGKNLKVWKNKKDSRIVSLRYSDRDRLRSQEMLTLLMRAYQSYLEQEEERVSSHQIDYLEFRQRESDHVLKEKLQGYARSVSADASRLGIVDVQQTMEFLAEQQEKVSAELRTLRLSLQRLQNAKEAGPDFYRQFVVGERFPALNASLASLRELKQKCDVLHLALQTSSRPTAQDSIRQLTEERKEILSARQEMEQMLIALGRGEFPKPTKRLRENSTFQVAVWEKELRTSPHLRESFTRYLENQRRFCTLYERTLDERLAHFSSPPEEFQGIDLEVASRLYLQFQHALDEVQSEIRQQAFIIDQLEKEEVEIGSLGAFLKDPVSQELVSKAGRVSLQLRDGSNRSEREQERLRAELLVERSFLRAHVQQTMELLTLRSGLLEDKLSALQRTNLELIQQQVFVKEAHIADYFDQSIDQLNEEIALLDNQKREIRQELATLPDRWIAEKMVMHQLKINEKMVEEIAKAVESKNISSHLEMVTSAPLDYATLPLHPVSPHLFLFTVLGALVGFFSSSAYFLAQEIREGFVASKDALLFVGAHVSGTLTGSCDFPPLDGDLATMRRLLAFLEKKQGTALWIKGHTTDYSPLLAALIQARSKRCLIVSLAPSKRGNLLSFLAGKIDAPEKEERTGVDWISCEKNARYAHELFQTDKFHLWLEEQEQAYDWVFVLTSAQPTSAEAETLFQQFPHAIVNLQEERMPTLSPYLERKDAVTFLLSAS